MASVPANDKIEEIQESEQLENPYDVPTPLLNIRNRSPKATRKSERNYRNTYSLFPIFFFNIQEPP